jgi:uncharacterized membrane protein
MSLRQCGKCSEMVEETKAFCPGCGHALVDEETRKTTTEFNLMDGTMQLGNTMYNQMLTDMGLNLSGAPNKKETAAEAAPEVAGAAEQVVRPAAPTVQPAAQRPAVQPIQRLQPAQPTQPAQPQVIRPMVPETAPAAQTGAKVPGVNKWLIVGGVVIVVGFILLIVAVIIGAALLRRPL